MYDILLIYNFIQKVIKTKNYVRIRAMINSFRY